MPAILKRKTKKSDAQGYFATASVRLAYPSTGARKEDL
jgi:hypothetical protein